MTKPTRPEIRIETQAEFVEDFVKNVDEWVDGIEPGGKLRPAYTLIAGAGASRSAGIPMQGEMDGVIESCLGRYYPNWEYDPPSYQDWKDSESLLFMACLCRANREPNLTHLVVADLASLGVFGPLLTTNFDDLMLSGFWSLPYRTSSVEPHVIYDVRESRRRRLGIRSGVPLVIKVHGHHTTYSMARRRQQVRRLIPDVVRLYEKCKRPKYGFVVVGYSGDWDDGIRAILRRKDLTKGLPVYWLTLDPPLKLKENDRFQRIQETCDLRFVRIRDSDELFLRLWGRLCDENLWLDTRLLDAADLFTPIPMSERKVLSRVTLFQPKWNHGIVYREGLEDEDYWKLPSVKLLQGKYNPILRKIEEHDSMNLEHDILRSARYLADPLNRSSVPHPDEHDYSLRELQLEDQLALLPSGVQWTRRNRALFSLALGEGIGRSASIGILQTLEDLSAQATRTEE